MSEPELVDARALHLQHLGDAPHRVAKAFHIERFFELLDDLRVADVGLVVLRRRDHHHELAFQRFAVLNLTGNPVERSAPHPLMQLGQLLGDCCFARAQDRRHVG